MVRAFSTLGCPESDLRGTIALAKRFGLDGIELRALADTVNLPSYFAAEHGTPEGFGAAMIAQSVPIVALDTSLHLADAKGPDREQFLAFIPWAEAAEIRWLRVFDGGARLSERAAVSAAAATVQWWREIRADSNLRVDIMVETQNRFFTAAAVKHFISAAPDTAILWDAHHTWKQGNEDPLATWRSLRAHIVHIHVKDSLPIPTPAHPYKYVLPGAGDFPMAALREALVEDGYQGAVSLEWEKLWHPELPPLEDALRSAEDRKWW